MSNHDPERTGVLLLNFGEPEKPSMESVVPFLERIFYNNAPLERFPTDEARRKRSRELALRRAPALVEDYKKIGGSPLPSQARRLGRNIQALLNEEGFVSRVYVGMLFIEPTIAQAVTQAHEAGVDRLVGVPVFPLCGYSTNVAALDAVQDALDMLDWDVPFYGVTGWHYRQEYVDIRTRNIADFALQKRLDLHDEDTLLFFSAHGTPIKYLDAGSRYDGYVEEHCSEIAQRLGDVRYTIGYQNHSNRGIAWTQPDNADHIKTIKAKRIVVVPISFMYEHSETLAELDIDFVEEAADEGITMYRVPVPHDDPAFPRVLVDVARPFLKGDSPKAAQLSPCRCRPKKGTFCTNGHRKVDCHYTEKKVQPVAEPVSR
ncbi:MAG: ferrochelatase [Bacteroidota bacterium]